MMSTGRSTSPSSGWNSTTGGRGRTEGHEAGHSGTARGQATAGLIARSRELSHLEHLVKSARRGRAGAIILRGEPGTGKRSIVETSISAHPDLRVTRLRSAPGSLVAEGSAWPAPLALLLGQLGEGTAREDRAARDAELAALAILEMRVDDSAPLLLVVEGCQWLPGRVLAALLNAVSTGIQMTPVILVLLFDDLPHQVEVEIPCSFVPEHRLGSLSLEQATELLVQRCSVILHPDVLRRLLEVTGGNPAALLDLAAKLDDLQRAGMRSLPELLPLSPELVAPFGGCLDDLPEDTARALAVVGAARCSIEILESALEVAGLGRECLEPALSRRILFLRGQRVELSHPLLGAAALARMPEAFRDEVHRALAEAFLEAGMVERAAAQVAQVASRPDPMVSMLFREAAGVARQRGDLEGAACLDERAADFAAADKLVVWHLTSAASSWISYGEHERALSLVDRAREVGGGIDLHAELPYQRARAQAALGSAAAEVVTEMRAAAQSASALDPELAALILCDAAARAALAGFPAVELAARAVELAASAPLASGAMAAATLEAVEQLEGLSRRAPGADWAATLVEQSLQLPPSPQAALLIGLGQLRVNSIGQLSRWKDWLRARAEESGQPMLLAVVELLDATACLRWGSFAEATELVERSAGLAARARDRSMDAQILALGVEAEVAVGAYDRGFERAARLLALDAAAGPGPRQRVLGALSLLELQRGRTTAAITWLTAQGDDALGAGDDSLRLVDEAAACSSVALLLSRTDRALAERGNLAVRIRRGLVGSSLYTSWARASLPGGAATGFDEVAEAFQDAPYLLAQVQLSRGAVELWAGRGDEARRHLEDAVERFEALGAEGWRSLVLRQLELLEHGVLPPVPVTATIAEAGPRMAIDDDAALWEISLLGDFAVRREGEPLTPPLSLSAQALKLVALRGALTADELAEHLWPEAPPGVGSRRLRNVLWRLRASCGDLLVREDGLIKLAPGVITDVATFSRLAARALDPAVPVERALLLARSALDAYRGELLPGDRYVEWADQPRASLERLHVSLLRLLLADAVTRAQLLVALGLVERLIEADPYEEEHYVLAVELHQRAGSRRSAASVVERARRMLGELGVAPSRELREAAEALESG